jgi:hypothetical protein
MTKRHAKPTALQLAERTYRRVLAIERRLARDNAPITEPSLASLQAIGWGARKDINDLCHAMHAEFATLRTLTDHCARLLREKETLQRRLYAVQESKTNPPQWLDDIVPPQTTIHSHEPGKPCTEYCKTIPTRPQL